MSKKRVLVMTGEENISDTSDTVDETYSEVHNLTLNSKEKYARKHRYDFLSIRSFGKDHLSKFSSNEIGHLRAYRAFKLLEEYDVVMWIDADSLITNCDVAVEQFGLNENQSFYASYDWEWKLSFSTGNFILNKTSKSDLLFETYYSIAKFFKEEQSTLNTIHNKDINSLQNNFCVLEHKFLGSIPSLEMYNSVGHPWAGRRGISWPWKKGDFLVHATGSSNKHRIAIFKNFFQEYL